MYVTQMDSPLTIIMELLLLPLVEELFFIFSLIDGLRLREEPKSPFRKALWCEIKRNYDFVKLSLVVILLCPHHEFDPLKFHARRDSPFIS